MDHPVIKWTLNSHSGQRQWTECEAKAVLEDLRTDEGESEEEGEEGESEEEGEGEEEGRAIAAGPPVAADETMENLNQDAEETETANRTKDKDDSVDGGKNLPVQDPVALLRSYTCGRCSGSIDLDSTFYRCVGHSCRGALTH